MPSPPITGFASYRNWAARGLLTVMVLIFGTGCTSYHIAAADQKRLYGWKHTSILIFSSSDPIACDVNEQGDRARCWTMVIEDAFPPPSKKNETDF
jgi:hypothetical protein